MDQRFYQQYAAMEDCHWWFVGRRRILERVVRRLPLPQGAQILEAGCGTGGNLQMLSRCGERVGGMLVAMEFEPIACELANGRGVVTVRQGSLPDAIPFEQGFDLILILDVLEHLDEDLRTLERLRSQLNPGGWLVVTVPAYQFLWSQHDVINHHKRRYRQRGLRRLVQLAGFRIELSSYFNSWLFPVVAAVRLLKNLLGLDKEPLSEEAVGEDLRLPMPLVNGLLTQLFASERFAIGRVGLPFGVSVVVVAQRTDLS